MYITITGELGSGKSTVAKLIQEKYGFMLYSTGTVQREIAKEKGITTLELNLQMAADINNDYDKLIDSKTIEIAHANRHRDVIFDSRMAWHFVEQSFKVYVIIDINIAAKRVITANRGNEEHYNDIEEAAEGLRKRKQVEDARFLEMYHVNTLDFGNYNLVVDSSNISPEELTDFVIRKARDDSGKKSVFLSPGRLFPTRSIRTIHPLHVKELQQREPDEAKIDVVLHHGSYFIMNGHHRACAKIQNGDKLIGVNILKADRDPFIEKYKNTVQNLAAIDRKYFCDWEEYNSIKLVSYPI